MKNPCFVILIVLAWFPLYCRPDSDAGKNGCPDNAGAQLVSLQGELSFDADGQGRWRAAHLNDLICEGARIRMEADSRASLLLPDHVILRLKAGTVLNLNSIASTRPALLDLLTGFVHFISRTPRHLEIRTPIVNAGPEGTEFALSVDAAKASLWVYEGGVRFFNDQGAVSVGSAAGAIAERGQAPRAQLDIRPEDAVNWALYYPSLLPYPEAGADVDGALLAAIAAFRQGQVENALAGLDALAAEKRTAYYYKVRAAMLLSLGRVAPAMQAIQALQALKSDDADALALRSVVALAQNDKQQALALAKQAAAADPHSATAFAALSYAEQAHFDLPKALAAAEQAVRLAPHDAMAWARQAELQLSLGLPADSEQAAKQALALDPNLESAHTVMGFASLLQMHTEAALAAFNQAVGLDSTAPLARLGLGLAKIRDGELEAGRQDLEIAVSLNPGNALLRSYLGKAYYEEKRPELAHEELQLAKQRDPKDPTAYFYDAILKLTVNNPIEALQDIDQAIALNDNRAVYRSSLALDRDLAARSAAQGRVYNELGYQQRGLLEGWKSLDADSYNYSAHRLLADDYAQLPRHEIARISELLQSQLLQPVNITPIQPNLEESSLFVLNSLGPSNLSFNDCRPPAFTAAITPSATTCNCPAYGIICRSVWGSSTTAPTALTPIISLSATPITPFCRIK
ncbi:MAG: FecR domain-containing protein [Methylomonas sp.]